MDLALGDKVVLVTGASRGIGRATALRLAAEGARLVLNHRRDEQAMAQVRDACRGLGAEVECLTAPIGEPGVAAKLVGLALERFGRLDVLVNNAGLAIGDLLLSLGDEAIESQLDTNVRGLVWLCRAALEPMLRQRRGCIVNLSSALASRPGRGNSVYAGCKGFVEAFTRALAVEMGRKGIRVNAVAPGVIETDMTAPVRAMAGAELPRRIGLRRLGSPDEVAAAIAFLASDQASYLNGAIVPVDGAFLGGE